MFQRNAMFLTAGLLLAISGVAAAEEKATTAPSPPPAFVRQIKVIADKAPDCSSLASIVESVTRGCKTNDEKAIAIYNFMLLAEYHRAYPGEAGGVGALKVLNVYGWSLCGGLHTVEAALWRQLGWQWRFVGWSSPGHTTVEAQYDSRWHYLDTFLKVYVWMPCPDAPGGRTIAGEDDIKANPALVTQGLVLDPARKVYYHRDNQFAVINGRANWTAPAFLVCGDDVPGIVQGVNHKSHAGSPTGWGAIHFDEAAYSTDVNLGPGYSLNLSWDPTSGAHWFNGRKEVPRHTCGDKDYRNSPDIGPVCEPYHATNPARSYANGTLVFAPDFSSDACLAAFAAKENVKAAGGSLVPAEAGKPASVTVLLSSPYIMTRASGAADGADSAEISLDGGKTYKPVDLKDFSDAVGGKYHAMVRLTFAAALKSLRLEAIVQHNRGALPYLSPGKNTITVSAAEAKTLGDNRLAVTYAYCLGSRNRSYEQVCDAGAELARAHYATWTETPTVVQKTFAAKDLPATFQIDVPTPKDTYPVYPRMLFVRREVLSPGAKPMPLPAGAVEPRIGPTDELKTLPNPFLIGIARAPAPVARPTVTRRFDLRVGPTVSKKGEAAEYHAINWQKDNSDAWVLLLGGDLPGLPAAGEIAAARLVLSATRAHEKAPTRVGAAALAAPFEAGKPYDFKNLGDVAGTTIVPQSPADGKDFDAPKEFKIDVTRAVKQVAAGETKFHGFGVRTVPDRGVDDGWTVRIVVPKDLKPCLEVDVFSGPAGAPKE